METCLITIIYKYIYITYPGLYDAPLDLGPDFDKSLFLFFNDSNSAVATTNSSYT